MAAKTSAWFMKKNTGAMANRLGMAGGPQTQAEANLLATSTISGSAIKPGQGYLGGENLNKVNAYSAQLSGGTLVPSATPGRPAAVASNMPGRPTALASNMPGMPPGTTVTGNVPGVGVQPTTAGGVQSIDVRKIQQDAKMAAWHKAKAEGKSDEEAENIGGDAGNLAGADALSKSSLGTLTAAMPGMPGAVPGVGLPGGDIGGMLAGLFGGGGTAAPAGGGGLGGLLAGLFGGSATARPVLPGVGTAPGGTAAPAGGGIGGLLAGLFGGGATAGPVLPGVGTAPGGADVSAGGAGGAGIASSLDAISKQLADMAANQSGSSGTAQVPLLEQLVSGQREQTAAIGRLLQNQTA
jgi:hypothetical protein